MSYCMILTTCSDETEAKHLASGLVKEKLAACVQLSAIQSYYTWKEKTCVAPEIRLVIKTQEHLYPSVEKYIQENHSYEVPQIIKIPITKGSIEYLDWLKQTTGS